MSLVLKMKVDGKFQVVDLPHETQVSVYTHLNQFDGTDCIIEHDNGIRKVYGIGNKGMIGKWCKDEYGNLNKIIMLWQDFCLYWMYSLVNYGIDTFMKINEIIEADTKPEQTKLVPKPATQQLLIYETASL